MHPPLGRPHELCQDVIRALIDCHEEHRIGKWFGACNDAKRDLDHCFKQEKEVRRKENLRKAREFDTKFEEYMKQKETEKTLSAPTTNSVTPKTP
eukprot:gene10770-11739_t